jgi:choline dehydrogenase-like flavoprotein
MHIDLNDYSASDALHAEICIIGGGAAGISAARRLLSKGHSVTLLESGGLDYESTTASLNAGANIGIEYYDLEDARLRFFGGTTAIWGGRIAQLDPIDLEFRSWVPHSGWPMSWTELQAYYPAARRSFGVPEVEASVAELEDRGVPMPRFDPARLEISCWDFDRRFNRFQFQSCRDLVNHPRCTLITHATVTELSLGEGGAHVESVSIKNTSGRAFVLQASHVVLSAGGIENARLLLASRSVAPNGIGNDHDLVGRYFMEHPHTRGGKVTGSAAWMLLNAFGRRHRLGSREVAALIKPGAALQKASGILNTSLTIVARQPAEARPALGMRIYSKIKHSVAPTQAGRAVWMLTKRASTWAQRRVDPLRPWLMHKLGLRELAILVRAEQAPNRDSRVVLTEHVDTMGVPRVALDWRVTHLDVETVAVLVDVIDVELRRLGLGKATAADWLTSGVSTWRTDPTISAHPIGGYHHMGTTRMARSASEGVTDPYGQVHGVGNLFVVGSSVFPTSGWANPTLTIVALAMRSADRISSRIAGAVAA